jgi:hypothetical protein
MRMQLERMDNEGFLPLALSEYLIFAETPLEAIDYVELQQRHG